jgi:hypothetical protein
VLLLLQHHGLHPKQQLLLLLPQRPQLLLHHVQLHLLGCVELLHQRI